jgi:predicted regulator of Ras-like GTPase activity (Roadblock/LC7/MglB family)
LASSRGFPPESLDQLAAIIAGLTSLAYGLASIFEGGRVIHTVVVMDRGLLIVRAISHGASLVALADVDCDIGHVAYEMALLGEQAGHALSPPARGGSADPGS